MIAVGLAIAQDQETLRIRTSVAINDPRFPQYLADLLGHRLTSSDSYVVHTNGDNALPAMLDAIDRAQERVSLETYNFEAGEIADRFTDALARAARRGVNVRMVLDSIGSKKMSRKEIDRLEEARMPSRLGQSHHQLFNRGSELSDASQGACGRWARRVRRRHGHRRSLLEGHESLPAMA